MRNDRQAAISAVLLVLLIAFYGWQISNASRHSNNRAGHYRYRIESTNKASFIAPDERIADWTEYLGIFTALLVVVSAVQILFLLRADKNTGEVAIAARLSANAAMEQVKLARLSTEAPLRAYLALISASVKHQRDEIEVTIKNNGRTPVKAFSAYCWRSYTVDDTAYESDKGMIPADTQISPDMPETFVAKGFDPVAEFDEIDVHIIIHFTFIDWFNNKHKGRISLLATYDNKTAVNYFESD